MLGKNGSKSWRAGRIRSRNITRSNLQRIASEFFDSTVPWNKIADRDRLGNPGLISDISKLLINLTELTYVVFLLCLL